MLLMLVDFDNVENTYTSAGPVALAKILVSALSGPILAQYDAVHVRLYGGWRSQKNLTTAAQRLVPKIRAESPANLQIDDGEGKKNVRLTVELAQRPVGTTVNFEETFVQDRNLRSFRARPAPWQECSRTSQCGLSLLAGTTHMTKCDFGTCSIKLLDIFVRNEQKMVDTMIVADMAHQVFVDRVKDIVLVSSDVDMWPGVLLALRAGCHVLHVHTKEDWHTQRHLMNTLDPQSMRFYSQINI